MKFIFALTGAGIGIFVTCGYSTFNEYFVRRRVFIMSVTQILIGLGTMVYPIGVQFLMDKYGYRGTVAIIAACNAHAIFAMLCMHPVKWHYKVIRIPIEEEQQCKFKTHSHFFFHTKNV